MRIGDGMRSLNQVLRQLIDFATKNDNIRGLVLQGSFVNSKASIDKFSDLDPLFYCKNVDEFILDFEWKKEFGEVISYFHDDWEMHEGLRGYTRLTIYKDGLKIDFGFQDIALAKYANEMNLYRIFVDKDKVIPAPSVTDDSKFFVKKPLNSEFQSVLKDFFFDSSYVVKTIFRDEITFNQYMIGILHKNITQLAIWYVGAQHEYEINLGIYGRYLKKYLTEDEYRMLKDTYPGNDYVAVKYALFKSYEIVRYFGRYISNNLGYEYPTKSDEAMFNYCTEMLK